MKKRSSTKNMQKRIEKTNWGSRTKEKIRREKSQETEKNKNEHAEMTKKEKTKNIQ